ncbi:MAG: serine hydrolase domain-containing protein [Pyrinomonadaceae bacterium]|nr:serine hydrolase domain-containing protein [Pyrinomonadaceae bacterium]
MRTAIARLMIGFFFAAAVSAASHGQSTTVKPNELKKKVDSLFIGLNKPDSPGAAITVVENGRVIAKRAYGFASIEHQVPFSHKTVVRLPYSEAREFMMIAAVLMEKDGKLSLNDKVRKYFPELPAWSDPVTVLDLMNHRSGFVDEWATVLLTQNSMANRFDRSQFLNLLYTQPKPEIEPTKGYMYSNSDMGLLKFILEKAAGEPLRDWMKKRMFGPLKMSATRMHDDVLEIVPNMASRYTVGREVKFARPDKISPGGNYFIATSADDLALWAAAHADTNSVITWATKQLLEKVRLMPGKKNHYIFGRSVESIDGSEVVVHQGVNGYTYMIRVPRKGIAVIGTTNDWGGVTDNLTKLVKHLLKATDAEFVKPQFLTKAVPVTEAELRKYEGVYLWQGLEAWQSSRPVRRTTTAYVADGVLKFKFLSYDVPLTFVGGNKFYFSDGYGTQVEFSKTEDGRDQIVMEFDDGYPSVRKIRESAKLWSPTREMLARFAGRYHSRHLDYYWTIVPGEGEKLILKRPTVADTELIPDGENTFRMVVQDGHGPGGFNAWVTFHIDANGNPTHLTAGFPRLMDHRFDRISQ